MRPVAVSPPQVEHLRSALGIGARRPRLSWRTTAEQPSWRQAAYAIEVTDRVGRLRCDTGRIEGDAQVLVAWPGEELGSRDRGCVRVRVWGTDGSESGWSDATPFETGLLDAHDWLARFITAPWVDDGAERPATYFRRDFTLPADVRSARLYVTALGVYTAEVNGRAVGDDVLAPGWTSYAHRVTYQTYDVTPLVGAGTNAIGLMVADGWFRGNLAGQRNVYGDRTAVLAQLEMTLADGTVQTVATDGSWSVGTGPIRAADLYDGETCDARLELPGWSEATSTSRGWQPAQRLEGATPTVLAAPVGPPVRRVEERSVVEVITTPSGATVLDFGQNLVGWLRLSATGPAGTEIVLRHGEVLEHGELCTRTLRSAKATDRYVLRGAGEPEVWEPSFTFHGFRYAEVSGWPGDLAADDITAVVLHSDLDRIGFFECSDPLVNRLHDNVVWSMRGNFLSVPTDCPQRDERLGWTGDIQVFTPTAAYLYDVTGFLASWLEDLALDQAPDGCVPLTIPTRPDSRRIPAAGWGDAAVLVPWAVFRASGDLEILARQFGSMCAWVDLLERLVGPERLWGEGFQFGDWLDPAAPNDKPNLATTASDLVATAHVFRSASVLAAVAEVLGETAAQVRYAALAGEVRAAFLGEYVTASGRLSSDTQTAYSLALCFGLIDGDDSVQRAGDRLAELVREAGYTLATGFLGTPLICDALTMTGHLDDAYRLLLSTSSPSWLAPLSMGATTTWERWDALLPDGSVNGESMTSFNHYALGAVADWLHRVVLGIRPIEPGYRRVLIAPRPGGGLASARGAVNTPYGCLAVGWSVSGTIMTLTVDVPANSTAVVQFGDGDAGRELGSGHHELDHDVGTAIGSASGV
ncbi:MAG: alpha-L-rhamnosidase [Frankiaceae bacterium]|nr:alpha-L-rhamnosidase [Frankiaceae bacterium]